MIKKCEACGKTDRIYARMLCTSCYMHFIRLRNKGEFDWPMLIRLYEGLKKSEVVMNARSSNEIK